MAMSKRKQPKNLTVASQLHIIMKQNKQYFRKQAAFQ